MSTSPSASFSEIVNLLYEASSQPGRWQDFLRCAGEYFASFGAHLLHLDQDNPELSFSYVSGFDAIDPDLQRATMRKQMELEGEDPRFVFARRYPNRPFCCSELMPVEEFRNTRVYRELLHPNGIEFSLMVQLSDTERQFTGLAFFRAASASAYSQGDVDNFGEIVPHLRQSLALQRRLFRLSHQLDTAYQVLDDLPSGVVIADEYSRIEFANLAAKKIFALRDGLEIREGCLTLRRDVQQKLLQIIRHTMDSGQHGAITLDRPSGKQGIQCVASRLSTPGNQIEPLNLIARPRVILHLSDPEQPLETPAQLLQRIFGLTFAEARVLEKLVGGKTPEQTAADHGVEVTTVRSQLKSIFSKTHTSRQPELVQRVLTSPVWMARNNSPKH
jgi:DNA-binding CsgD family transcriptional regulator/PAS domain-containing protein